MTREDDSNAQYSDTTRAVLDLALDRLATQLPDGATRRLRALVEERRLADADAVLAALNEAKDVTVAKDQVPHNPSGSRDS
jgi:hypothetical protein